MNADVVVIGAGTVGAAIAYGLALRGTRVLMIDGGDRDFRAATANFGLVWLHGKGMGMPAYQRLTGRSVDLWPDFSLQLAGSTKIDLQYERNGGLALCRGEAGFAKRSAELQRLQGQLDGTDPDWDMLDRAALSSLLPKIDLGFQVSGASFGHRDGHANPLRLLAALQMAFVRLGGQLRGGCTVNAIRKNRGGGFVVAFGSERVAAERIVIAAGLGSKALVRQVGLDVPIRPQRGQLLVTERFEYFLPIPTMNIRQTSEGTVMIGATNEEVGFDTSATNAGGASLAANAIREIPKLSEATLVRQWAGLRILTPDGYPIYAESQSHPGAFVALCHSGVTLAAGHATFFADAVAAGRLPPFLDAFHHRRFDVRKAA